MEKKKYQLLSIPTMQRNSCSVYSTLLRTSMRLLSAIWRVLTIPWRLLNVPDVRLSPFPKVIIPVPNQLEPLPYRVLKVRGYSSLTLMIGDTRTENLSLSAYQQAQLCERSLYSKAEPILLNTPKKGFSKDYQLRFFIREGTVWPPHVHTFPQVQGPVEHIDNHLYNVQLIHLAENYLADMLEKCNRYTTDEVLKKQSKNYGVGALLFRPFWRFFNPTL